jgi:hypothetical protein
VKPFASPGRGNWSVSTASSRETTLAVRTTIHATLRRAMSACSTPSHPYWMASVVTVPRGAGGACGAGWKGALADAEYDGAG